MAAFFGKQHKDVLKAIRNLLENLGAEMRRCFIERSEEVQRTFGGVDVRHHYEMTRDGFTLLAMGFTGPKALAFKVAYIERFNAMEAEIASRRNFDALATAEVRGAAPRR